VTGGGSPHLSSMPARANAGRTARSVCGRTATGLPPMSILEPGQDSKRLKRKTVVAAIGPHDRRQLAEGRELVLQRHDARLMFLVLLPQALV